MKSLYLTLISILLLVYCSYCQYTTIAIIGINDIHGTALPTDLERQYP